MKTSSFLSADQDRNPINKLNQQPQGEAAFADQHAETVAQRRRQALISNSADTRQQQARAALVGQSVQRKPVAGVAQRVGEGVLQVPELEGPQAQLPGAVEEAPAPVVVAPALAAVHDDEDELEMGPVGHVPDVAAQAPVAADNPPAAGGGIDAGTVIDKSQMAADIGGNTTGLADVFGALTNFGDHADVAGGKQAYKSVGDHFARDGKSAGTDFKTYNNSWANPVTAGVGAGFSMLGGIASVAGAAKNGWQAGKDLASGDTRTKIEAGGTLIESAAGATSAGFNVANSVNNAAGAVHSAAWNVNLGAVGGEAIPVLGAITGGIGMVKNGYQIAKNYGLSKDLRGLAAREGTTEDTRKLANYAATTTDKRLNRAGVNLASNTLSTAGAAATLSGVGAGVGAVLGAAGAGVKYGAMAARNIKQYMRDNHEHKRDETYATWLARQEAKIADTWNPVLIAKYKMIISKTPNWDKTTAKKDAERNEMTANLIGLLREGAVAPAEGVEILKSIGGSDAQIADIRAGKDLTSDIIALFKTRE